MPSLLPFILKTVRKRAIDPANRRFFLPAVLQDTDGNNSKGKLLPIEEDSWPVGPITGDAENTITPAFTGQWANYLEKVQKVDLTDQYPIASPSTPHPTLTMGGRAGKLVVGGLENIFVWPDPKFTPIPDGYQIAVTLQLEYWDGSGGRPQYPMLSIFGGYRLQQSLCLADKGATTPNGNGETDVDGSGTVDIAVEGAFVDAVLNVSVKQSASGRELDVVLVSLLFRGKDAQTPPSLHINKITIDASVSVFLLSVWETMATRAIESPDGSDGIFRNLNASLNDPSNLGPLSSEMGKKLSAVLDGLFGKAAGRVESVQPATTLNPVDRYLFDRIRFGLNAPGNSLFLPQLLCQNQNPALSPLTIGQVDIPTFSVLGLPWQNGSLTALDLIGLTNVQAPPDTIQIGDNQTLQFTGVLGGWNPPPHVSCSGGIPAPPATGTANFSITPQGSDVLTGTLNLTVSGMKMIASCRTDGTDDSDLTIAVESLQLAASNIVSSLQVSVNIQSAFESIINKAINTQAILQKILDAVNSQVSGKLVEIGAQVTTYARKAIQNGLN